VLSSARGMEETTRSPDRGGAPVLQGISVREDIAVLPVQSPAVRMTIAPLKDGEVNLGVRNAFPCNAHMSAIVSFHSVLDDNYGVRVCGWCGGGRR